MPARTGLMLYEEGRFVGLLQGLGTMVVVGALAGSGYAAYELYEADQLRDDLADLRAEVGRLSDQQTGMRAGVVSTSELSTLTELVQRLDADLTELRAGLAAIEDAHGEVVQLRADHDALRRSTDALTRCLERGLVVDEDTGRAHCAS